MGRGAIWLLAAVAAGSAFFGYALAAASRDGPAAPGPGGGASNEGRRLREENERLRGDLDEARKARDAAPPPEEPAPALAPAPAPAPAPAAGGATLRKSLDDALRAAPAERASLEAPALEKAVRDALEDPSHSHADRWRAVALLATRDPEGAYELARGLLDKPDAKERSESFQALLATRERALLPVLTAVARSSEPPVPVNQIMNAIANLKDRPWSAVQITGEPDTIGSGDLGTAWAAKKQEMGEVWIELVYARAVFPDEVRIRETLCPGSVARILARENDGTWTTLWEGVPTAEAPPRWFAPPLHRTSREIAVIRIILDTDRVQGWEEIDAVELVSGGAGQWAVWARASSSYAD